MSEGHLWATAVNNLNLDFVIISLQHVTRTNCAPDAHLFRAAQAHTRCAQICQMRCGLLPTAASFTGVIYLPSFSHLSNFSSKGSRIVPSMAPVRVSNESMTEVSRRVMQHSVAVGMCITSF